MTPVLALLAALAAGAAGASESLPVAGLRGLDKFSGLTTDFDAVVGETVGYGRLIVRALACRARPDGEVTAYLDIRDARDPETVVFAGWMIASSPALSALDHPRYDVWLLSCKTRSAEAS